MAALDRAGIAKRLRALIEGQDGGDLSKTAARLGLEEVSLRMSIDEDSPHPTVEVLAAVIGAYGVDPSWLLKGTYDPATHRSALEGNGGTIPALREAMSPRPVRISQPARESFRLHDEN